MYGVRGIVKEALNLLWVVSIGASCFSMVAERHSSGTFGATQSSRWVGTRAEISNNTCANRIGVWVVRGAHFTGK